jgi:hypothetical protein
MGYINGKQTGGRKRGRNTERIAGNGRKNLFFPEENKRTALTSYCSDFLSSAHSSLLTTGSQQKSALASYQIRRSPTEIPNPAIKAGMSQRDA